MTTNMDPTLPIREQAAAYEAVVEGTSCNQASFKTRKGSFLFIGPGPKGVGYKAMFKLKASRAQAEQLAKDQPQRFEVGSSVWVTTRFSAEEPLTQEIWGPWLDESYALTQK